MSDTFLDLFSKQSGTYAQTRPLYPRGLFEFLASQAPTRDAAWDFCTGSGQAAIGAAEFFANVQATDASATQIAHSMPNPRVDYSVRRSEESGFADASFDCLTGANAVHWLRMDDFYKEAKRVLKPGGVIAVWGVGLFKTGDAKIDAIIDDFAGNILRDYWAVQIAPIASQYRDLPFPFAEIANPGWAQTAKWSLPELCQYWDSWSAVQKYKDANGTHSLVSIYDVLAAVWGDAEMPRPMSVPLSLRIGRNA